VSGPRQAEAVRRALDVEVDGAGVFDVVQATWNLLEPSAGPALAEAKGRGRGVIVKEALANGRLSPHGEGPPLAMLGRLAARHGVGVDAVALAAALANPWADVVLSGAVSAGQLAGNLAAARLSLADDELEELRTLAEPAEAYWAARGRLRWA
jgi:aryl-alcohol dehydrogenase-like predicted oxidoreductase